eukprot:583201_1
MMTFIFRYAYLLAVCLWGLQLFGMVSTAQLPDYNQGVNPSNVPSDLKEEDPPSLEYAENECAWGACPNSSNIPMPKLKRCKGCKSTYYCGKSCQKRHWNSLHRFNCSEIQTNENQNEEKKEIPVGNEELYVEKKRNSSEKEIEKSVEVKFNWRGFAARQLTCHRVSTTIRLGDPNTIVSDPWTTAYSGSWTTKLNIPGWYSCVFASSRGSGVFGMKIEELPPGGPWVYDVEIRYKQDGFSVLGRWKRKK